MKASLASSFFALLKARFKEYSKYPIWLLSVYLQIILVTLVFFLAASLFAPKSGNGAFWIIPISGIFLFSTGMICMQEMGWDVFWMAEQGVLESLMMAPVNPALSLFAYSFVVTGYSFLVGSIAVITIALFSGVRVNPNPTLVLAFVAHTLFMLGIGYGMAGLSFRLKRGISLYLNFLNFFFVVFSGYFYPFSALPRPMLLVSRVLPASYMVDLFRYGLTSDEAAITIAELGACYLVSLATSLAAFFIGLLVFFRELDRARVHGYLGTY